jgi:ElaB/YqjD/DUF883 family membrane-anchored ribosome-binding protein
MSETKERIEDTTRMAQGLADRGGEKAQVATQAAIDRTKDATSGVVGAVKDKVHDVAAGASDLVGKASDKAQQWASSVGDVAVYAKDKAQDWASSVGDAAVYAKNKTQQMASATAEKAGDLGKDVTALIRRHPIPALLVGLGAGFLIGQVCHYSSSKKA